MSETFVFFPQPVGAAATALSSHLSTSEGRLLLHLVREYLSFLGLKYSLSVLEAEASSAAPRPAQSRPQLVRSLGLSAETMSEASPLLSEVLRLSKVAVLKSETPTLTERCGVLRFSDLINAELPFPLQD